jgi:hypothetical protein
MNDAFGWTVASAGDVNGDGFADVVVGAWSANSATGMGTGTASIYLGSMSGLAATPARVLVGAAMNDQLGGAVASAGDVNGDGFADVVVGAIQTSPGGSASEGTASIYLGSASGLAGTPARVFVGTTMNDGFGDRVAGAGDVNGDGFADVVIGARSANSRTGTASIYLGSMSGLAATPAFVFAGTAIGDTFGGAIAMARDVMCDRSGT